ncbi:non-specific serine/threonine protein kinase [Plasmodiophora brassicae]
MRKREARQREKEHDLEVARRMRVNEEQETEIEALQAILGSDIRVDDNDIETDHDYPRAFSINVVPHPAGPEENYSFVDVVVRLHREYPAEPPDFFFRSSKGLSKAELEELLTNVKDLAKRMRNEHFIYDVVTLIQEELRNHNQPSTSLHEEMVQKHLRDSVESAEVEKRREHEERRKQAELNTKLEQLRATETLSQAAEQQLRKKWLESRDATTLEQIAHVESLRSAQKESQRNVEVMLAFLLHRCGCDPLDMTKLSEAGLISPTVAALPPSALAGQYDEVAHSLRLSVTSSSSPADFRNEFRIPAADNPSSAVVSGTRGSRYASDFIEIQSLGQGSFGRVTKVQNRLDGLFYAMKVIKLQMENNNDFRRILREVTTLSRLSHPFVLRYYQAFIEKAGDDQSPARLLEQSDLGGDWTSTELAAGSLEWSLHSDSLYRPAAGLGDASAIQFDMTSDATRTLSREASPPIARPVFHLYIQTEFCAQTLRDAIVGEARRIDPDQNWRRFRQILEGLAHIHSQGIVHRDLKPGNIFVHPSGDVRIGDLGLATHLHLGETIHTKRSPSSSPTNTLVGDQTMAVGTLLYIAPEVMNADIVNFRYDSKVDMYSLGIILFEMWYPFSTAHERVAVLQRLRDPNCPVFPDCFQEAHPRQSQIICWLLQADPSARPSALELLQSSLLPPKLEDEYMKDAMRTIANPNTPFYHRLLAELFNCARPMPSDVLCISGLSLHSLPATGMQWMAAASRQAVLNAVRTAFEAHSAIELSGNIMTPVQPTNTARSENDLPILLMDREGRLLDLRRDLRRDLLMSDPGKLQGPRYFQIGTVFRQDPSSSSLSRPVPRHVTQADFDIVGADASSHYADGEIAALMFSLVNTFPAVGEARLAVGHTTLTQAVLDQCRIPEGCRAELLSMQVTPSTPVDTVRTFVSRYGPKANVALLLSVLNIKGAPNDALTQLRNHFVHNRTALNAIDELQKILASAALFGLHLERVEICPLLSISSSPFSSFIAKSFVISDGIRSCLAVGGRFDDAMKAARSSPSSCRGVGLSLAIEQLWDAVAVAEARERRPSRIVQAHCTDVFVASVGSDEVFDEKLRIVGDLYGIGINVAFLPSRTATLEEQQDVAATRGASWLLTIKDKYLQNSVRARQLDTDRKQEFDLAPDEIVKFFAGVGGRKR